MVGGSKLEFAIHGLVIKVEALIGIIAQQPNNSSSFLVFLLRYLFMFLIFESFESTMSKTQTSNLGPKNETPKHDNGTTWRTLGLCSGCKI